MSKMATMPIPVRSDGVKDHSGPVSSSPAMTGIVIGSGISLMIWGVAILLIFG